MKNLMEVEVMHTYKSSWDFQVYSVQNSTLDLMPLKAKYEAWNTENLGLNWSLNSYIVNFMLPKEIAV